MRRRVRTFGSGGAAEKGRGRRGALGKGRNSGGRIALSLTGFSLTAADAFVRTAQIVLLTVDRVTRSQAKERYCLFGTMRGLEEGWGGEAHGARKATHSSSESRAAGGTCAGRLGLNAAWRVRLHQEAFRRP